MSLIDEVEPHPLPESQPYWDGIARDELWLQQCSECTQFHFPPAPACPHCSSRDLAWRQASGCARLYSFVIAEHPWPQWHVEGPMSVALVELAEGPRIVSTIVDCPQTPEALQLDMVLRPAFRTLGTRRMLCFTPARENYA